MKDVPDPAASTTLPSEPYPGGYGSTMNNPGLMQCLDLESCDLFQILDITQKLSTNIALDEVLKTVVQAAQSVLRADRATVFLYAPETDELYSRVATEDSEIRFSAGTGIAGETARTRGVIVVSDCYADSRFNPEIDRKTGYKTRCLLSLPLIGINDKLVGVLQVLNKRDGVFTQGDERLGRIFAAQCAVALQRATLIEEYLRKQKLEQDLAVARDIQMGVLPKELPRLAGYDLACWSRPAEETDGDIYDALALEPGETALLLGDATGHGIGPALSVTQMRAMVRMGLRMKEALGTIMAHVNAQLKQDLPSDRFITAFLGVVNSIKHKLYYYSCGQAPLLHYHAKNGTVEWLDASSPPLGILENMIITSPPAMILDPGDIVGILSDGFFEYENADRQQFGQERVAEIVASKSSGTMADLIGSILDAIADFSMGEPQADDMTAVFVCRRS